MGRQARIEFERLKIQEERLLNQLKTHKGQHSSQRNYSVEHLLTEQMVEWSGFWVRLIDDWTTSIKSNNLSRQRIDLLRYLFQKYPVPRFLEAIWDDQNDGTGRERRFRVHRDAKYFIPWYIALASGLSLYKDCAYSLLSRKEVHLFVNAPDIFSPSQNVWWARARGWGATLGCANNIARSKISRQNMDNEFWISCARFFVKNSDVMLHEMDNLIDYIAAKQNEDEKFSLKGRTIETVRRGSENWHRLQTKLKELDGTSWPGDPLDDWSISVGSDEKKNLTSWKVRQIKTGKELVKEGHAQHHCVASYKHSCIQGNASIWSMTYLSVYTANDEKRALTIELSRDGTVVQAKGYANRSPNGEEKSILNKWMDENSLSSRMYY